MSSIVVHIRFTEKILAHASDGLDHLKLPPPANLNELVRTAVSAGLALMVGHDWPHKSPSQEGFVRVRSLTKQPMKSAPSDLILTALNQVFNPLSNWESIDIIPTISNMPDVAADGHNAKKVWSLMSDGHVSISEQLTCNDGTVDRLASYLLWHHREHFPAEAEQIEQVYNEYHKGD